MLEEMFSSCLPSDADVEVRPCLQEGRKILERARINFSFGSAKISIGVVTSGEGKEEKLSAFSI